MDTPFGMSAMSAFSLPGPRRLRTKAERTISLAHARLAGMDAVLDPTGALYWPDEDLLVVSDLHLETGSSYARTGQMLPPYDTAITLASLTDAFARHRPSRVISLGDTFHDPFGAERLRPADRATLDALTDAADFIWVTGNHEHDGAGALGGTVCDSIRVGGTVFRHIPSETPLTEYEVAGHLHPAIRVTVRGRTIKRRCFAGCDRRLVMPAMGCLTGGLSITDPAFAPIWPSGGLRIHLLGHRRVMTYSAI